MTQKKKATPKSKAQSKPNAQPKAQLKKVVQMNAGAKAPAKKGLAGGKGTIAANADGKITDIDLFMEDLQSKTLPQIGQAGILVTATISKTTEALKNAKPEDLQALKDVLLTFHEYNGRLSNAALIIYKAHYEEIKEQQDKGLARAVARKSGPSVQDLLKEAIDKMNMEDFSANHIELHQFVRAALEAMQKAIEVRMKLKKPYTLIFSAKQQLLRIKKNMLNK